MTFANRLGIGPMGFGGRTTLLGTKVTKLHRVPASHFVSVSYMCWACRRASVAIQGDKVQHSQLAEMAKAYR
jgi:fumarate hydratase class I